MEIYVTDLTLSFGFCYYFPFQNFLSPAFTLPRPLASLRPRDGNKGRLCNKGDKKIEI